MITDVLGGTLGYNGIVMTDMLGDSAITARYSDGDAAVAAIVAGADILLCPADFSKAYQGVLDAVSAGTITEERIQESLYRIYRVKYKNSMDEYMCDRSFVMKNALGWKKGAFLLAICCFVLGPWTCCVQTESVVNSLKEGKRFILGCC